MDMENRKRYIREVLDEDMNMKQRVVDLNRYKVMGIVDEVTPYVQIDQDEVNKMRVAAATLSQVLEKKARWQTRSALVWTRTALTPISSTWLTPRR